MREVQIIIRDDLDQTPGAETYTFAWDGIEYEVDLSPEHYAQLDETLGEFIAVARQVKREKKKSKQSEQDRLTYQQAKQRKAELQRVRKWANAQGMPVSERSRIPARVQKAYNDAHPHDYIEYADETFRRAAEKGNE